MANNIKESRLVYECDADACHKDKKGKNTVPSDRFMLYLMRKKDSDCFCGAEMGSANPADIRVIAMEDEIISFVKGNIKYSAIKNDTGSAYIGNWEDNEGNGSDFRMHPLE